MKTAAFPRLPFGIILIFSLIPGFLSGQQVQYSKSQVIEKADGRDFVVHEVEKGQTLYSISRLYGIALDSLYHYNIALKEGTRTGMKIRIPLPVQPASPEPEIPVPVQHGKDSLPPVADKKACDPGHHRGPFDIALVMPLYLREIDSLPAVVIGDVLSEDYRPLRFLQFYEGARMAVDSLVASGLSVNLHVFDIDEDTNKIRVLLKDPAMTRMDLIIGLLYGPSFSRLAEFGKANRIPVVNPLSNKRQFIDNNEWVFLANSTVGTMASQIAVFLTGKYADHLIIMLNSGKENEKRSMGMIYDELLREAAKTGMDPNNIKVFSGDREIGNIPSVLASSGRSAVIILSNDELFVASVMRYLKEWSQSYPLMVFGMPGWLEFKSLESRNLVDLNFHSFGNSFVDYTRPEVKSFVLSFRETYKTEPNDLAFQGYDVTWYFLRCLSDYGVEFPGCAPFFRHKGLQSRYHFTREGHLGFENAWLNIYRIENYQVIDARE